MPFTHQCQCGMLFHAKFHDLRIISSVGEDFTGLYHKLAWWPSWSCDLYHLLKLPLQLYFDWPSDFREKGV